MAHEPSQISENLAVGLSKTLSLSEHLDYNINLIVSISHQLKVQKPKGTCITMIHRT